MRASVYDRFPVYAKDIREAVFREEQGFQNEFDEIDHIATHIVLFNEDELPIATCRIFWNKTMNAYTLGRLAVIKKCRGKNIGSAIVREAEKCVQEKGGTSIVLHSQCQASGFYKKLGYKEFGNIENEEGCPHIWMKKSL